VTQFTMKIEAPPTRIEIGLSMESICWVSGLASESGILSQRVENCPGP